MKYIALVLAMICILAGCTAEPTWETMKDELDQPAVHQEHEVVMDTSASLLSMESEWGRIYLYEGFDVCIQIQESGDLGRTLQTVTGFQRDELMLVETSGGDFQRFDCAWSAMSADGQMVGRTILFDDGVHHYCITMTTQADHMAEVEDAWLGLITSIRIV